jgi:hypothetical protein
MTPRTPPGYYPLDIRYRHVLGAGCVLLCTACGVEAHGPIPRLHPAEYNAMVETFIREHRGCADRLQLTNRGAA